MIKYLGILLLQKNPIIYWKIIRALPTLSAPPHFLSAQTTGPEGPSNDTFHASLSVHPIAYNERLGSAIPADMILHYTHTQTASKLENNALIALDNQGRIKATLTHHYSTDVCIQPCTKTQDLVPTRREPSYLPFSSHLISSPFLSSLPFPQTLPPFPFPD